MQSSRATGSFAAKHIEKKGQKTLMTSTIISYLQVKIKSLILMTFIILVMLTAPFTVPHVQPVKHVAPDLVIMKLQPASYAEAIDLSAKYGYDAVNWEAVNA